jgi:excisionase family DNA binding protein
MLRETEATPLPEGPDPRVVLLTVEEVAAILKVTPRAVYKLARRHRWGFQRTISRRCVRYERRGLLDWIRRRPGRRN